MILLKFQIDCVTFSSRNSPVAIHHIQFKNQLSYNRLQSPLTFSSVSSILFQPHWPSQCSSKSTRMRLLQNVCTCSLSLFSFFTTHLLHLFPHFSRSLIKSFLLCVPSVTIVWKNCIPLLSTTMLLLIDWLIFALSPYYDLIYYTIPNFIFIFFCPHWIVNFITPELLPLSSTSYVYFLES